ncbi:hypothetical protein MAR_019737 [Mya arenaria]|uniref:Uncharacterized protein n=1 Tax=Mya arenaria TaxID=6604 RepID=A0ABY7E306_MYAAR|nr:hypothetical protein MAR_019737 [Mya arenaria]
MEKPFVQIFSAAFILSYPQWLSSPIRSFYPLLSAVVILSYPQLLSSPIRSGYPLLSAAFILSYPQLLSSPIRSFYPLLSAVVILSYPQLLSSPIRSFYPLLSAAFILSYPQWLTMFIATEVLICTTKATYLNDSGFFLKPGRVGGQLAGLIVGAAVFCLLLYLYTLWRGTFLVFNKYCSKRHKSYNLPTVIYHVEKTEPPTKRSRRNKKHPVLENGEVNILFKSDGDDVPKESVNRLKTKRVSFSIEVIEKDEQESTEKAIYNSLLRTLTVQEPPIRESAETYQEVDLNN